MKIRSALIITIAAILFLIPAMALGQRTSNNDSDQELELQIGDKVLVLEGIQKHRIGTIAGFTGSFYHVEGLPHEYMGSEYYLASELERVDMRNQFQGIEDLRNAWRFLVTAITGA